MEKSFRPKYELCYKKSPVDENDKKWYAQAVSNGLVTTDTLARALSARCTLTRHDVKAVLSALQEIIGEYIQMGCAVRLDDLGIFSLRLKSKGAEKADEFNSSLVTNTMLRFLPSDGMKQIVKGITEQWTQNGISGGRMSQTQYAAEKGA